MYLKITQNIFSYNRSISKSTNICLFPDLKLYFYGSLSPFCKAFSQTEMYKKVASADRHVKIGFCNNRHLFALHWICHLYLYTSNPNIRPWGWGGRRRGCYAKAGLQTRRHLNTNVILYIRNNCKATWNKRILLKSSDWSTRWDKSSLWVSCSRKACELNSHPVGLASKKRTQHMALNRRVLLDFCAFK